MLQLFVKKQTEPASALGCLLWCLAKTHDFRLTFASRVVIPSLANGNSICYYMLSRIIIRNLSCHCRILLGVATYAIYLVVSSEKHPKVNKIPY